MKDDYINIAYNISDNSGNNIKLENVEDYTDLENKLNNKKEQSEPNGSDCSSLVRLRGLEPPWSCLH